MNPRRKQRQLRLFSVGCHIADREKKSDVDMETNADNMDNSLSKAKVTTKPLVLAQFTK